MDTKETKPQKQLSLEEANNQARAQLSSSASMEEVIKVLIANKGKAITPEAIALAIGDTADKDVIRRTVFQKTFGLSKKRNAVKEITVGKNKKWIWLIKVDGKNAYALTNPGIQPK